MIFCYNSKVLPFLNNPKDLDPSYKMDKDFWDCFGKKKLSLTCISEEIQDEQKLIHGYPQSKI